MPKKTNEEKVNDFFKPDENGVSEWKTWKKIEDSELTFRRGQGNNHRKEIWWGVSKYKWSTLPTCMRTNNRFLYIKHKAMVLSFYEASSIVCKYNRVSISIKLLVKLWREFKFALNCGLF